MAESLRDDVLPTGRAARAGRPGNITLGRPGGMPSPEPAGNFTVGSLSVGRTARLGGTLTVEKTAGLKVEAGATAEVITAPAVSGRFNLVRGIKGPGPALTLAYGPASVTLAAPQH